MRPGVNNWVWIAFFAFAAGTLIWQAATNAPTSDEAAHLVSGVAVVKSGDPGFYRVNPPLHKLISGLVVAAFDSNELPGIYPASLYASGTRREFDFAETVLVSRGVDYRRMFFLGRLPRIPLILLCAWLVWTCLPKAFGLTGWIASILWLSSPLILGHGWAVMPDALSACAMTLLLLATLRWLGDRSWLHFLVVGVAWGIAIGTKFTFCPLYLLWPIGLGIHEVASGRVGVLAICRLAVAHLGHGVIALIIVVALYEGRDVGVPLGEHQFQSSRLTQWISPTQYGDVIDHETRPWLASLPSPFPKQFLVGIDEQQIDLERGHPTYVSGVWYPDGVGWYYIFGLIAKEQLVFLFGLIMIPIAAIRLGVIGDGTSTALRTQRAGLILCLFVGIAVMTLLSAHSRMALNVRYLLPALPAFYLAIGIACEVISIDQSKRIRRVLTACCVVAIAQMCWVFPHFYAYINPLLGGSYVVPLVLHDSNFDGGQDLWRFERAVADGRWQDDELYCYLRTDVPETCIRVTLRTPPDELLEKMIQTHSSSWVPQDRENLETTRVLVVSRGFQAPAPWTSPPPGQIRASPELIEHLLRLPPDVFLTPTLCVYRLGDRGSKAE